MSADIVGDLRRAEAALARVRALADELDETALLQLETSPTISPYVAIGHVAHRIRAAMKGS